jgi:hypothetical protein
MFSNLYNSERLSDLENQYISQLKLLEKDSDIKMLFGDFLLSNNSKKIPGVDEVFTESLHKLVTESNESKSLSKLLTNTLLTAKILEPSKQKTELLQNLRTIIINFVKYCESTPVLSKLDKEIIEELTYNGNLSTIETDYLKQLSLLEVKQKIDISTFYSYMDMNSNELHDRYNGLFIKLLNNTKSYLDSNMKLSTYYNEMVSFMRDNGKYERDLTTLNSIILRFLTSFTD